MAASFITNLFAATVAHAVGEDTEDEDSGSSDKDTQNREGHVGYLDLVQKTLKGIAMHSVDGVENGMGHHGATIVLGTKQKSIAPLTDKEERMTQEPCFEAITSPVHWGGSKQGRSKGSHTR